MFDGFVDCWFGMVQCSKQCVFLIGFGEFWIGVIGVFYVVFFFGLCEDVVGVFQVLQQVSVVFGFQCFVQCGGVVDQQNEIVIVGYGDGCVDDVVVDVLIFQEYFEVVVEEGEEVGCFGNFGIIVLIVIIMDDFMVLIVGVDCIE